MRRWATFGLGIVLALGVASPAHAAAGQHHRYVANDFASFVLASESQSTGDAVDGTVLFVAPSDHIVLTLHDAVAKGTVPVVVNTTDGSWVQCVSATGRATRIDGFVRGEWAGLTLLDATFHGSCHTGATAGQLTIA
ncbi:MAG TPA: hypothetical protein VHD87_09250 [Acidimicrobiales bacterium]|nr:hypothetical protein [Acidimicrobiales bacterium]